MRIGGSIYNWGEFKVEVRKPREIPVIIRSRWSKSRQASSYALVTNPQRCGLTFAFGEELLIAALGVAKVTAKSAINATNFLAEMARTVYRHANCIK